MKTKGLVFLILVLGAAVGYLGWQNSEYKEQHSLLEERFENNLAQRESLLQLQKTQSEEIETLRSNIRASEVQIQSLNETKWQLESELQTDDRLKVSQTKDQVDITVLDGFLFAPGNSHITEEGEKVLQSLIPTIERFEGNLIRVIGHTDDLPISEKLKTRFSSNWELASQRSVNVVKYIKAMSGIDPAKLEAASAAQYRPIADNGDESGRKLNRRIEIQLISG